MEEKHRNPDDRDASREPVAEKKPYQKPSFRFEKVFETMALACGKINFTQKQCRFRRMNS